MSDKKAKLMYVNKPSIRERSINRDLTVILVLMVFLVSMITLCSNYFYVTYQEKKRLEGLANEYLTYLNQSLELPIWTLDKLNAKKIADSYFNNELVATLEIFEKTYEAPDSFSKNILFSKKKENETDLLVKNSDIRHNGNIIGEIRLGLTKRIYQENLKHILWSSIITMLLIVLSLMLMTSIMLRLFMKKPLDMLMSGINQISKGNYDYTVSPVKQKEFKSILSNFMYMANQINRREKSLADVNLQLEAEVIQRKNVEEDVRRSEAQLRAIIESSADGILVTSDNGMIINANDRFYRMWQIPDELKLRNQESTLFQFMMDQLKQQDNLKIKIDELHRRKTEVLDEIYFKDGRVLERFSCPLILGGNSIG